MSVDESQMCSHVDDVADGKDGVEATEAAEQEVERTRSRWVEDDEGGEWDDWQWRSH